MILDAPEAWHKLRSVEKVEDVYEQWANGAAWMGFDESNATDPGSWENLVELPMRGLHKRVDYADYADYGAPSGTLGEGDLLGKGQKNF